VNTAPSDTPALAELLIRTSWRLRRNERKALEPFALTFAQARALRVLAYEGPMRMSDLAAQLEIVPRTATTRVDDLERAGLVTRGSAPRDRRSVLVQATTNGHELVSRLAVERRASADLLFARLTPNEQSELASLLAALCGDGTGETVGGATPDFEVTP
jgi:DNA-binding MarR family transcriptional regulator